jgi:hypothetical protein
MIQPKSHTIAPHLQPAIELPSSCPTSQQFIPTAMDRLKHQEWTDGLIHRLQLPNTGRGRWNG